MSHQHLSEHLERLLRHPRLAARVHKPGVDVAGRGEAPVLHLGQQAERAVDFSHPTADVDQGHEGALVGNEALLLELLVD